MTDYEVFELGDIDLQSGLKLPNARLAYKTYGELNAKKDNAIVFPTFYSSNHTGNEPLYSSPLRLVPSLGASNLIWEFGLRCVHLMLGCRQWSVR